MLATSYCGVLINASIAALTAPYVLYAAAVATTSTMSPAVDRALGTDPEVGLVTGLQSADIMSNGLLRGNNSDGLKGAGVLASVLLMSTRAFRSVSCTYRL